jgi:hypothetical protein
MIDAHTLNKAAHILAGSVALGIGLVPLLSRKGGHAHRLTGWVFAGLGAVTLSCAAVGVVFFPHPGPLMVAALTASYQYLSGMRALSRFRPGPGPLDAALALGALALGAAMIPIISSGNAQWRPALGYSMLGFLALIILYDLSRYAWADVWQRAVRPIDHGLKMTGTYFAMASAGFGNLFPAWQPFSPAISGAGALVMIVLAVQYVRRRRLKAPTASAEPGPDPQVPAFA